MSTLVQEFSSLVCLGFFHIELVLDESTLALELSKVKEEYLGHHRDDHWQQSSEVKQTQVFPCGFVGPVSQAKSLY